MKEQERQQTEIEKRTLQYGAALVKECMPKMQEGGWQHFTTAQKVFYLYMQAERHAKGNTTPAKPKHDLERVGPEAIEKAVAGLIGLPPL